MLELQRKTQRRHFLSWSVESFTFPPFVWLVPDVPWHSLLPRNHQRSCSAPARGIEKSESHALMSGSPGCIEINIIPLFPSSATCQGHRCHLSAVPAGRGKGTMQESGSEQCQISILGEGGPSLTRSPGHNPCRGAVPCESPVTHVTIFSIWLCKCKSSHG